MIFYFTATGNSLYTAEKIAEKQEEQIISISECIKNNQFEFTLSGDEKVGFVFPVYFYGLPTVIYEFLEKLVFHNYRQNYIFGVCTCGGSSGYALNRLDEALRKKNLSLNFGYTIRMPDNYIILFNLIPAPPKMERLLKECDTLIQEANQAITQNRQEISSKGKGPFAHMMTILNYPIYKNGRKTAPFYATDACTGCGLCGQVCPVQMIYIQNRRPGWEKGRCVQCLACIHRCPVRAIEYGNKTVKRGRYLNPNIRWKNKK